MQNFGNPFLQGQIFLTMMQVLIIGFLGYQCFICSRKIRTTNANAQVGKVKSNFVAILFAHSAPSIRRMHFTQTISTSTIIWSITLCIALGDASPWQLLTKLKEMVSTLAVNFDFWFVMWRWTILDDNQPSNV